MLEVAEASSGKGAFPGVDPCRAGVAGWCSFLSIYAGGLAQDKITCGGSPD